MSASATGFRRVRLPRRGPAAWRPRRGPQRVSVSDRDRQRFWLTDRDRHRVVHRNRKRVGRRDGSTSGSSSCVAQDVAPRPARSAALASLASLTSAWAHLPADAGLSAHWRRSMPRVDHCSRATGWRKTQPLTRICGAGSAGCLFWASTAASPMSATPFEHERRRTERRRSRRSINSMAGRSSCSARGSAGDHLVSREMPERECPRRERRR